MAGKRCAVVATGDKTNEQDSKRQRLEAEETVITTDVSSWECGICFDLLCDPVVAPCGHDFCKHCIQRWSDRQHYEVLCPICRGRLGRVGHVSLGVCVRLKEWVEHLFPVRSADRRKEVLEEMAADKAAAATRRAAAAANPMSSDLQRMQALLEQSRSRADGDSRAAEGLAAISAMLGRRRGNAAPPPPVQLPLPAARAPGARAPERFEEIIAQHAAALQQAQPPGGTGRAPESNWRTLNFDSGRAGAAGAGAARASAAGRGAVEGAGDSGALVAHMTIGRSALPDTRVSAMAAAAAARMFADERPAVTHARTDAVAAEGQQHAGLFDPSEPGSWPAWMPAAPAEQPQQQQQQQEQQQQQQQQQAAPAQGGAAAASASRRSARIPEPAMPAVFRFGAAPSFLAPAGAPNALADTSNPSAGASYAPQRRSYPFMSSGGGSSPRTTAAWLFTVPPAPTNIGSPVSAAIAQATTTAPSPATAAMAALEQAATTPPAPTAATTAAAAAAAAAGGSRPATDGGDRSLFADLVDTQMAALEAELDQTLADVRHESGAAVSGRRRSRLVARRRDDTTATASTGGGDADRGGGAAAGREGAPAGDSAAAVGTARRSFIDPPRPLPRPMFRRPASAWLNASSEGEAVAGVSQQPAGAGRSTSFFDRFISRPRTSQAAVRPGRVGSASNAAAGQTAAEGAAVLAAPLADEPQHSSRAGRATMPPEQQQQEEAEQQQQQQRQPWSQLHSHRQAALQETLQRLYALPAPLPSNGRHRGARQDIVPASSDDDDFLIAMAHRSDDSPQVIPSEGNSTGSEGVPPAAVAAGPLGHLAVDLERLLARTQQQQGQMNEAAPNFAFPQAPSGRPGTPRPGQAEIEAAMAEQAASLPRATAGGRAAARHAAPPVGNTEQRDPEDFQLELESDDQPASVQDGSGSGSEGAFAPVPGLTLRRPGTPRPGQADGQEATAAELWALSAPTMPFFDDLRTLVEERTALRRERNARAAIGAMRALQQPAAAAPAGAAPAATGRVAAGLRGSTPAAATAADSALAATAGVPSEAAPVPMDTDSSSDSDQDHPAAGPSLRRSFMPARLRPTAAGSAAAPAAAIAPVSSTAARVAAAFNAARSRFAAADNAAQPSASSDAPAATGSTHAPRRGRMLTLKGACTAAKPAAGAQAPNAFPPEHGHSQGPSGPVFLFGGSAAARRETQAAAACARARAILAASAMASAPTATAAPATAGQQKARSNGLFHFSASQGRATAGPAVPQPAARDAHATTAASTQVGRQSNGHAAAQQQQQQPAVEHLPPHLGASAVRLIGVRKPSPISVQSGAAPGAIYEPDAWVDPLAPTRDCPFSLADAGGWPSGARGRSFITSNVADSSTDASGRTRPAGAGALGSGAGRGNAGALTSWQGADAPQAVLVRSSGNRASQQPVGAKRRKRNSSADGASAGGAAAAAAIHSIADGQPMQRANRSGQPADIEVGSAGTGPSDRAGPLPPQHQQEVSDRPALRLPTLKRSRAQEDGHNASSEARRAAPNSSSTRAGGRAGSTGDVLAHSFRRSSGVGLDKLAQVAGDLGAAAAPITTEHSTGGHARGGSGRGRGSRQVASMAKALSPSGAHSRSRRGNGRRLPSELQQGCSAVAAPAPEVLIVISDSDGE